MKNVSLTDSPILILESYPEMRAAMRDALEDAGFLVTTAGDLGAALDHLKELHPHLLIIAPYINSMPGHIAADYIRHTCPGLPVMIVAGFMDDDRIGVQNANREFYTFPAPFTRGEFLARVREIMETEGTGTSLGS